jgi:nucleoid DNA-binding protein
MEKIMSKTKTKVATKSNHEISTAGKVNVNLRVKTLKPRAVVYKDKQTRTEIFHTISENTRLSKTQVEQVFDELNRLIEGHLKKRGSGEFIIPKTGIKLRRIKKKPSKERTMVSPLTGKEVTISAKPARLSVKLTALKVLKEVVDKQ